MAPATFGRFAGDLIAPSEASGRVFAITPEGAARLVADSGLPHGNDIGVESESFIPPRPGLDALLADRLTAGQPHPGDDLVLRFPGRAPRRRCAPGRPARGHRGRRAHGRRQLRRHGLSRPARSGWARDRPRRGPHRLGANPADGAAKRRCSRRRLSLRRKVVLDHVARRGAPSAHTELAVNGAQVRVHCASADNKPV